MVRPTSSGRVRQNQVQRVVTFLERNIVSGRFPNGQRLVEADIAQALGTSRTPVREAIRIVATEGLVTNRAGRGAAVATLTRREIEQLFDIRGCLENFALALAVPRITPQHLRRLRQLHARMSAYVEARDVERFRELDGRFHKEILDSTDNDHLVSMLASLAKKIARLRHLTLQLPGELEIAHRFHGALLDAIEAGDATGACELHRAESADNKAKLLTSIRLSML